MSWIDRLASGKMPNREPESPWPMRILGVILVGLAYLLWRFQ